MNAVNRMIDVLWPPAPPPAGWRDDLPEAFGALDKNGEVYVIGYQGRWFTEVKLTRWVRLHNWIVSLLNRKRYGDST